MLRARSAPWKSLLAGSQQRTQLQRQLAGAARRMSGQEEQGSEALGPAVAAGGGLWFMPRKGAQKVRVLSSFCSSAQLPVVSRAQLSAVPRCHPRH